MYFVLLQLIVSVFLLMEGDSPHSDHFVPECSAGLALVEQSTRDELSASDGGSLPVSQPAATT